MPRHVTSMPLATPPSCATTCWDWSVRSAVPASIIIKTFDAIQEVRDAGVAVIGGFHSPMERQCFDILLRGNQPVILCAAKGLPGLRLGKDARCAISENRLLVISPFDQDIRRTTAVRAVKRNDLVAALADVLWVPHAVPGGKTWTTIRRVLDRGQTVYTFANKENAELIELGAQPLTADEVTNCGTWGHPSIFQLTERSQFKGRKIE